MHQVFSQSGAAYAEIIRTITSPLALAALGLLLGAAVLRLFITHATKPTLKLLVHYLFVLAIILSVGANLTYIFHAKGMQDIRFAGTVADENSKGISKVVVEIAGKGRGITDDYGAFDFTIPRSRAEEKYEVSLYRLGYASNPETLEGPNPPNRRFIMRERGSQFEDFVVVAPTAHMRVFCGLPAFGLHLDMLNPTESPTIRFEQFRLSLESPHQEKFDLVAEYSAFPPVNARLFGFVPPLDARNDQPNPVYLGFWKPDIRTDSFFRRLPPELLNTQTPPSLPEMGAQIIPDELVKDMATFFTKSFVWTAGIWRVTLETQVRGKRLTKTFTFEVKANDLDRMKKTPLYFSYGAGFLFRRNPMNYLEFDWRYGEFGNSASEIPVTLTAHAPP